MVRHFALMALALVCVLALSGYTSPSHARNNRPIEIGDHFPQIPLPAPAVHAGRRYLGLGGGERFTLSEVRAKVVLVEILSTLCPSCLTQTKFYTGLFQRLESDPQTRGKVKILGIAVANTEEEIQVFRDTYEVPFPVVSDARFTLYHAIGGGQAPFSIYVLQAPMRGPGVVAGTHKGVNPDMDLLFAYLSELAVSEPAAFRALAPATEESRREIAPLLSPQQLQAKVLTAFNGLGGKVAALRAVDLKSGRQVFTALIKRDGTKRRFFAEMTARHSICDVCHDIHFIYLFDANGRVVGFEPLHLTKYANAEWDATDLTRMRQRVLGRHLSNPLGFDPKVDAVTSATLTSAIIFDQLSQGEALMAELREQGLL